MIVFACAMNMSLMTTGPTFRHDGSNERSLEKRKFTSTQTIIVVSVECDTNLCSKISTARLS
jgi:hypothetical protein